MIIDIEVVPDEFNDYLTVTAYAPVNNRKGSNVVGKVIVAYTQHEVVATRKVDKMLSDLIGNYRKAVSYYSRFMPVCGTFDYNEFIEHFPEEFLKWKQERQ